MAVSIPTSEPTTLRAGDSWRWTRAWTDYPSATWDLTYTLTTAAASVALTATAASDGVTHEITVLPADSEDIAAGRYDWIAQVSDGADQYTIDSGVLTVLPDLSALDGDGYDGRSPARVMLDAIDAALASRATAGQLDQVQVAIGDRRLMRDPAQLLALRRHYAAIVAAEDQAAARARGEQGIGLVQVRFR
jgi:hypothetical protein